jgi:hypothetical protein
MRSYAPAGCARHRKPEEKPKRGPCAALCYRCKYLYVQLAARMPHARGLLDVLYGAAQEYLYTTGGPRHAHLPEYQIAPTLHFRTYRAAACCLVQCGAPYSAYDSGTIRLTGPAPAPYATVSPPYRHRTFTGWAQGPLYGPRVPAHALPASPPKHTGRALLLMNKLMKL